MFFLFFSKQVPPFLNAWKPLWRFSPNFYPMFWCLHPHLSIVKTLVSQGGWFVFSPTSSMYLPIEFSQWKKTTWPINMLYNPHVCCLLHVKRCHFETIEAVLMPTQRKHNVIFLNLHGNCNRSDPHERLETVRISSVLSFGALMISEPTNRAETESFKVGMDGWTSQGWVAGGFAGMIINSLEGHSHSYSDLKHLC